jgi:hypothetical protein
VLRKSPAAAGSYPDQIALGHGKPGRFARTMTVSIVSIISNSHESGAGQIDIEEAARQLENGRARSAGRRDLHRAWRHTRAHAHAIVARAAADGAQNLLEVALAIGVAATS